MWNLKKQLSVGLNIVYSLAVHKRFIHVSCAQPDAGL